MTATLLTTALYS